ncbi:MAG TPA: hypothetical protein VFF69_03100 [Phycisphaerales bacterium]|nr:hypothetical protein [Phycisphaerales bacterium]
MTTRPNPLPSGRAPLSLVRAYLLARAPAALATDGLMLLALSVLVSHLWRAFYSTLDPARLNVPTDSCFAAAVHPTLVFPLVYEVCTDAAWIVLGWSGVRMISDAVRSRHLPGP